ncbi:OsmC family protein [Marimonas sp. MJW-29]|uniref:OsmC family protein n=1 Tax=Sulfitobacter sediminis TaxID=3234186 RepID=A0ABV3RJD9_9RHOB
MAQVRTVYDGDQHCTASDAEKGLSVEMDCPYSGKGAELSPGNLLEAALAGCMLIAMGPTATREGIDLAGAAVKVTTEASPPPKIAYTGFEVAVTMPAGLTAFQRTKLERAADSCPIKHAFREDIRPRVRFVYPD